LIFGW